LNCGSFVEKNYCPNCGQENSESRKKAGYLIHHFITDLLHYEGKFWQTIRVLLIRPAKLSTEYMNGRRKSYVNPVTLYIFISFIAFFLPSLLSFIPSNSETESEVVHKTGSINIKIGEDTLVSPITDSIESSLYDLTPEERIQAYNEYKEKINNDSTIKPARKIFVDSLLSILKSIDNDGKIETSKNDIIEFFILYLPKVLIFYMPIFAFLMWLFHINKRRHYFDSGIFTLHFFSFVLLTISIFNLLDSLFGLIGIDTGFSVLLGVFLTFYVTWYFYKGNRKFYGEGTIASIFKVSALMILNFFFILLIMVVYTVLVLVAVANKYGLISD